MATNFFLCWYHTALIKFSLISGVTVERTMLYHSPDIFFSIQNVRFLYVSTFSIRNANFFYLSLPPANTHANFLDVALKKIPFLNICYIHLGSRLLFVIARKPNVFCCLLNHVCEKKLLSFVIFGEMIHISR